MNSEIIPHFEWNKDEIQKYADSLVLEERCVYYLALSKKLKEYETPGLLDRIRGLKGLSSGGKELLNWLESKYDISYRQYNNLEIITQRDKALKVTTVNNSAHIKPNETSSDFALSNFSDYKLCLEKIDIHSLIHELQKRGFLKIEQKYINEIFSPVANEPIKIENKAIIHWTESRILLAFLLVILKEFDIFVTKQSLWHYNEYFFQKIIPKDKRKKIHFDVVDRTDLNNDINKIYDDLQLKKLPKRGDEILKILRILDISTDKYQPIIPK